MVHVCGRVRHERSGRREVPKELPANHSRVHAHANLRRLVIVQSKNNGGSAAIAAHNLAVCSRDRRFSLALSLAMQLLRHAIKLLPASFRICMTTCMIFSAVMRKSIQRQGVLC